MTGVLGRTLLSPGKPDINRMSLIYGRGDFNVS